MSDPQPETNATALARELAGVRAKLQAERQAHEQTRRGVAIALRLAEEEAAEARRLYDLLARLEWAGGIETGPGSGCVPCCPVCEVEQGDPHGHDPGCDLAAVLHPANDETAAP